MGNSVGFNFIYMRDLFKAIRERKKFDYYVWDQKQTPRDKRVINKHTRTILKRIKEYGVCPINSSIKCERIDCLYEVCEHYSDHK